MCHRRSTGLIYNTKKQKQKKNKKIKCCKLDTNINKY